MPKVTMQSTGQSADADNDSNLRDTIQNNGWPVPFGCENGICGTCLITIPSGKENISTMEMQEEQTLSAMGKNDGEHRLACQCKIQGDVTIDQ